MFLLILLFAFVLFCEVSFIVLTHTHTQRNTKVVDKCSDMEPIIFIARICLYFIVLYLVFFPTQIKKHIHKNKNNFFFFNDKTLLAASDVWIAWATCLKKTKTKTKKIQNHGIFTETKGIWNTKKGTKHRKTHTHITRNTQKKPQTIKQKKKTKKKKKKKT